jgi:hypothetical protein
MPDRNLALELHFLMRFYRLFKKSLCMLNRPLSHYTSFPAVMRYSLLLFLIIFLESQWSSLETVCNADEVKILSSNLFRIEVE